MDPPGFTRRESLGSRPYYLTLPKPGENPRKLSTIRHVEDYLEKEKRLDVKPSDFDFSKRKRKSEGDAGSTGGKKTNWSDTFAEDAGDQGDVTTEVEIDSRKVSRFNLENLIKSGVQLDDRKILEETAAHLDVFRLRLDEPEFEGARLAELRLNLSGAVSLQEMVMLVSSMEGGVQTMGRVVEDHCLQELLTLSAAEGDLPLSQWPNSVSKNWFSEVCFFARQHSPVTLSLLLRLCVKEASSNVQPKHVINIATVYSQIAMMVDKTNNTLAKMNTLQLKMDNLSDDGIDSMAKLGLTTCSRNLRNDKAVLAEVQEKLLLLEAANRPEQLSKGLYLTL